MPSRRVRCATIALSFGRAGCDGRKNRESRFSRQRPQPIHVSMATPVPSQWQMSFTSGVRPRTPTSNTERQRQFRKRNPGYYGRLRRKQKAEAEARAAARKMMAAWQAEFARMPLMLPAPDQVSIPLVADLLRDLEAAAAAPREAVMVERAGERRV